ncbi:hypothetical protein LP421_18470 [Rhizobium sp. RCAM05350]|nr:hypothetical protein LP421_18470 [Rhizobium sp. RCAM05350]
MRIGREIDDNGLVQPELDGFLDTWTAIYDAHKRLRSSFHDEGPGWQAGKGQAKGQSACRRATKFVSDPLHVPLPLIHHFA